MRRSTARRGLTLVELLVTIALMLLIMSIIVALFTAATEGMTIARKDQELASVTRRLDTLIRQDLAGATAHFTPPLDPNDGLGYFEYIENSHADAQDEDSDDILAFTAKAPPGLPFTGRIMLPRGFWDPPANTRPRFVPTTITSDFAEIIYFMRHNRLYRRVLLIVPDRAESISNSTDRITNAAGDLVYRYSAAPYYSDGFDLDGPADPRGNNVPDVSWQGANDISVRPSSTIGDDQGPPVPNTLGDLTNRHNRAFRQRFRDDYYDQARNAGPDGEFDDLNTDGAPDLYPTLTPGAFGTGPFGTGPFGALTSLVNEPAGRIPGAVNYDTMPFPFVFPGAYSLPNPFADPGSIHLGPIVGDRDPFVPGDDDPPLALNHSPLDINDNLRVPDVPLEQYTWWGFPTWAETRALGWTSANKRPNRAEFNRLLGFQAFGLSWQQGLINGTPERLPVQKGPWYSDLAGYGDPDLLGDPTIPGNPQVARPHLVPEQLGILQDDLIATNVRSFDVKALEPNGGFYGPATSKVRYLDLGYAASTTGTPANAVPTFGHEGRIPPIVADNRFDPNALANYNQLWPIGDDSATTVRMRRTWDSWSTDYTNAPLSGINPYLSGPYADTLSGFSTQPLYPSYPPPYPSPLYGIQIQIRLAAPDGSRAKVITIRQDFTDKL